MKGLLSIKEFSGLSGISTTTLRYWDNIGIFSPQKRNPANNYRYYTADQLISVKFLTVLSDLKVQLTTISDRVQERSPEIMMRLIEQQEGQLQKEMDELRLRYSIMFARRELIGYGMRADEAEISIMRRESKEYILGPRNEYKDGDTFLDPLIRFWQAANEYRIDLSLPIGGYHDNIESYIERTGKPDHFFSLDPTGNRKFSFGDYLVGFKRGYYGEMGDLPERMVTYAEVNSLVFTGPVYIIYLHDEICIKDPSQYLAQVCVAVSKQKTKRLSIVR